MRLSFNEGGRWFTFYLNTKEKIYATATGLHYGVYFRVAICIMRGPDRPLFYKHFGYLTRWFFETPKWARKQA